MLFDGEKPIAPPSPLGLGAAMAGGGARGSKTVRQPNDYYPTPDDCTAALLVRELKRFGFDVLANPTETQAPDLFAGAGL